MQTSDVMRHARALYAARGDEAEAEAARNARRKSKSGQARAAADWQAIRAAIRGMRGAPQG